MNKISLALVDSHPIMLEGVLSHFSNDDRFNVVGRGMSCGEALDIIERHHPDLLIMELSIPGNALRAIARIIATSETTKVIVFTAAAGIDSAIHALDAGATGYVLKNSTAEQLGHAITTVARGDMYITELLAGKVIRALRSRSQGRVEAQANRLSVREEQIVRHLLRGQTNKEIAASLLISEKTVKHYMTVLMQKLNARNRLEVVLAAQKLGHAIDSNASLDEAYAG